MKVEVWDVVDKGRKRKKKDGLKLATDEVLFTLPVPQIKFVGAAFMANGLRLLVSRLFLIVLFSHYCIHCPVWH